MAKSAALLTSAQERVAVKPDLMSLGLAFKRFRLRAYSTRFEGPVIGTDMAKCKTFFRL